MKQIINYIKLREQLLQTKRAKSGALGLIRSGLVRFGSFLAYRAIERYFLYEEMQALYAHPNYKYFLYLALFFGLYEVYSMLVWEFTSIFKLPGKGKSY